MARSRRSSAFTDLLDIASKLPWKVSLALAAFAAPPAVTTVADMGGVVIHQGVHVGALFLQFLVPPAFLIGAAVSYFKKSRSIRRSIRHRALPRSPLSQHEVNSDQGAFFPLSTRCLPISVICCPFSANPAPQRFSSDA
jgi:hypothetical protein